MEVIPSLDIMDCIFCKITSPQSKNNRCGCLMDFTPLKTSRHCFYIMPIWYFIVHRYLTFLTYSIKILTNVDLVIVPGKSWRKQNGLKSLPGHPVSGQQNKLSHTQLHSPIGWQPFELEFPYCHKEEKRLLFEVDLISIIAMVLLFS